jgi:hypothetical protein
MEKHRPQLTFRTRTYDAPEPAKSKAITPGQIQPGKLGIYKGRNLVGQCGRLGTAATCRRFGVVDAKFKNGAWRGR